MDIFQSIAHILSTTPVPDGTANMYGAIGNQLTCSIQGFLLMAGAGAPVCNLALSFHYINAIQKKKPNPRLEPLYHIIPLIASLLTGIIAWVGQEYNNHGTICFVSEYPLNCREDPDVECTRGLRAYEFGITYGVIIAIAFFGVFFNMTRLVYLVHAMTEKSFKRYASPGVNQKPNVNNIKKRKAILVQASLYVWSFFITYIWVFINGAQRRFSDSERQFPLIFLSKVFFPLQGFFNFFIFIRHRVKKIMRQNSDIRYIHAIFISVFRKGIFNESQQH
jgi:hypothetical protein